MPVLFFIVVIDLIGFGIILPIMPFLAPEFGGSDFDIAMMIAVYSVFAGICGPFWGKLSDRFGRKPVILTCLTGTAASYLLLASSTTLEMVYLSRIFCGLMAGNFGVASAMIADITTEENRAKGMGLIGAGFGVGLVIGPFIGGLLAGEHVNFIRPAIAAATMSIIAMIAGSFILKESHPKEKRLQPADELPGQSLGIFAMIKHTGNSLLISQYFLHNTCISLVGFLFPLMARDYLAWGPKEIGIIFGIQGLLIAILQGSVIGPASKRYGELRCLTIGISSMIIGFLCLAFFAHNATTIVGAMLATITGATFTGPMLNSLTSKRTPQHLRGRMMGTATSVSAWGRVFAPLTGGAMLGFAGFSIAWLSGVVAGGLILAWVAHERRKPSSKN
jgi:DHA1 family tetracycline resistance protein-like MFS transporter